MNDKVAAIDKEIIEAMERGRRARDGIPMYDDEGKPAFNYPWDYEGGALPMHVLYFNNLMRPYGTVLGLDTSKRDCSNLLVKILKPSNMTIMSFKMLPSSEKLKIFMKNSPRFSELINQLVKVGILDASRFEDNSLDALEMITATCEIQEKLKADQRLFEQFLYRKRLANEGPGDNSSVKRLIAKIVDNRLTDLSSVQKLHGNIMAGLSPSEQDELSKRLVSLMEGNQSLINRENRVISGFKPGDVSQSSLPMGKIVSDSSSVEGIEMITSQPGAKREEPKESSNAGLDYKNKVDICVVTDSNKQPVVKRDVIRLTESFEDPLLSVIESHGFEVIDRRSSNGALWIIDSPGVKELVDKLAKDGFRFSFAKNGSRSTGRRPGWYL